MKELEAILSHLYVLDENGDPAPAKDVGEWACFFMSDRRQLALNKIAGMTISTVFLGVALNPLSPRLALFESMSFDPEGRELRQLRATSRKVALEQHATLVADCRRRLQ